MVICKFPGKRAKYTREIGIRILSGMVMIYFSQKTNKKMFPADFTRTVLKCLFFDLFVHDHLPFRPYLEILFQ